MIIFDFWNPDDLLLTGGMNVLLQVTFVTATALLLALFLRRNPAARYGLLCSALILILLTPVITLVMQVSGKSLWTFSLESDDLASRPGTEVRYDPVVVDSLPMISSAGNRERQYAAQAALPDPTEPGTLKRELHSGSVLELSRTPKKLALVASVVPTKEAEAVHTLRITLQSVLLIWLVGTVIVLIRQFTGWSRLTAILRTAKPNTSACLAESFSEAGRMFPQNRLPELVLSAHISGPVSTGLFRPRVIFPEQIAGQITPEALRDIFIHEIAHSVRRDQVILLIQNLVSALCWLHPLVKVLNRQLAQAREEVCDNFVLTETDAPSYSRTLLSLARLIPSERVLPGAIGLFTSRWKLEHRVAGLLDQKRSRLTRLSKKKLLLLVVLSLSMAAGIAAVTFTPAVAQTDESKPTEPVAKGFTVRGTITTHEGKPAAGAQVKVIGLKPVDETKPDRKMLAEGVADKSGHYELSLPADARKKYTEMSLLARTEFSGIYSRARKWHGDTMTVDQKLPVPSNGVIQFVDPEGRPAKHLSLEMELLNIKISATPSAAIQPLQTAVKPAKRPQNRMNIGPDSILTFSPRKTDDQGKLLLNMFDLRRGVTLKIPGSEKFAPQWVILNSGQPEERSKHDGTYRDIVKNIKPGEELTIVLAPAQWFSGRVLLGDSGKPAANTRIKIWASQEEPFGSMVSVEGKTDEAGRFRLNPRPGVRFGIVAYPPPGTPYLTREVKDLRWTPETSKEIEIKLDKVVLAEGFVRDAKTGQPLQGASVQYYPEMTNDKRLLDDIVSGWQSSQKTDTSGKFQIPVLPGPGTLLVHAAEKNYILQERDSEVLNSGKPGGTRMYAHAFQKINPAKDETLKPMKIEMQPGATVAGTLIDEQGQSIKHAIMISRLKLDPLSPDWRGLPVELNNDTFELHGLREGVEYPVYFLDPKNRLGAVAKISARTKGSKIVLKPCGSANARYVDSDGKPIAEKIIGGLYLVVTPGTPKYDFQAIRSGKLWADEELVFNIDRVNYSLPSACTTDADGKQTFPALIPGATYRHVKIVNGQPQITHEFTLQPGEQKDLGEIEIQLNE
ncbi:M56 family metallopeptidase [Gimesia algae]|uniref:Regulatory protein BlaR1 n=1 Tax=Gimesia algae TaxID=2527971 RepID=A0A517V5Y3_9PLAN|nr:M56 family metallopeptidase [Gimesia algae]QDT88419.1 Regulatory protein BlaR1 [Gimesia algae]